jgi:hypothetical protein
MSTVTFLTKEDVPTGAGGLSFPCEAERIDLHQIETSPAPKAFKSCLQQLNNQ